MRRKARIIAFAAMCIAAGCEMQPMQRVKPTRERVGMTQVEAAQRDVDRTLEQYRRDREAARREAMQGSDP
jgi:hypothetical protein